MPSLHRGYRNQLSQLSNNLKGVIVQRSSRSNTPAARIPISSLACMRSDISSTVMPERILPSISNTFTTSAARRSNESTTIPCVKVNYFGWLTSDVAGNFGVMPDSAEFAWPRNELTASANAGPSSIP